MVTAILLSLVAAYLLFCLAVVVWDKWKYGPKAGPKTIKLIPDNLIRWYVQRGKWSVCFRIRSQYAVFSRFGAGWSWALGARMGSSAILFTLLIAEVYVCWQTPAPRTWADKKDDNS